MTIWEATNCVILLGRLKSWELRRWATKVGTTRMMLITWKTMMMIMVTTKRMLILKKWMKKMSQMMRRSRNDQRPRLKCCDFQEYIP